MTDRQGGPGRVLRLRNLAMVENIRRAENTAWRERLEQQQVLTFGRVENPLQAMRDHADALKEELRWTPLHCTDFKSREEADG